ncbi:MAG: hypothetical protein EA370_01525 [Wenzhouxiangella sp.]|nr:MAG: hypothetical protein EA370_01525 [Wenzhouxiangella sp.]
MARQNFWSGLVVAAFALLALTWMIPNYAGTNPMAQMPPGLVPSIAAWIMLVCGLIVALGGLVGLVRGRQWPVTTRIDWAGLGWTLWPFVYVAAAIYVLTFVKITWFGVPLIAGLLFLLGERRWYLLLGCSVVPVAMLYVLSVHMMRIGVV